MKYALLKVLGCCFGLLFWSSLSSSLIHNLEISNDGRDYYPIESFGFEAGGVLHMKISNFKIKDEWVTEDQAAKLGFLLTKSPINNQNDWLNLEKQCQTTLQGINPGVGGSEKEYTDTNTDAALYTVYFANCLRAPVSYSLFLENYNIDANGERNYLSAGYVRLPALYVSFTVLYFICLLIWIFGSLRGAHTTRNRVHYLMTLLLVFKILSVLFRGIEYYRLKIDGKPGGWGIAYDIFAVLKGFMFFIVIALIGTGWRFIKPFLSDKDKRILMVVVPLQVLDNIALVYLETAAPGSRTWLDMKKIFQLVDIICCGAILIPIVWSIKHLREASQSDGKVALNMKKLTLFRQFYLMVVSYIYFTRIIVYLVDSTLPYNLAWLADFFIEMATLIFFTVVGYKFRPAADNPYFQIPTEDEAKDLEMQSKEEKL
jgi:NADH:ubiquinone oxidoreductase subunit 3 (subunit A)